jgi:hypothetical protein
MQTTVEFFAFKFQWTLEDRGRSGKATTTVFRGKESYCRNNVWAFHSYGVFGSTVKDSGFAGLKLGSISVGMTTVEIPRSTVACMIGVNGRVPDLLFNGPCNAFLGRYTCRFQLNVDWPSTILLGVYDSERTVERGKSDYTGTPWIA